MLLVARTSGSPAAAGLTGGALAAGQVACGPLVGRLADRHGRRTVVLTLSLANTAAIAALVAGALAGPSVALPVLLGAVAGATVPLIGPLSRARLVAPARRSAVALTARPSSYPGRTTETALHARVPHQEPTTRT